MIIFQTVSKQFLPESTALKDVSFQIDTGEFVLITGPSGSGKTTIMKLLTKEYSPTDGTITFNGQDLAEIKPSKVHTHRRKIGVVFQDYKLIPELNVWENIALPLSIIGKKESEIESRVTDLLELVSLTDKALHFPKQLSGGEAQRISIARALSTGPAIIFADEPTGNLDKENSLQIAKLLEKINSLGTTVLFATHDHDVIDLFEKHRHITLEKGILASDTGSKNSKSDDSKKKETKKTEESAKESTQSESSKESETDSKQPEQDTEKKPGFFARLFGKSNQTSESQTQSSKVKQKDEDNNKDEQTAEDDKESSQITKQEKDTQTDNSSEETETKKTKANTRTKKKAQKKETK